MQTIVIAQQSPINQIFKFTVILEHEIIVIPQQSSIKSQSSEASIS